MKNRFLLFSIIISIVSFTLVSCFSKKDKGTIVGTEEATLATPQINSEYMWRYGVITAIPFTNKIGKGRPTYDEYYLLCSEGEYYIKLMECKNLSSLPIDYENYYIKMRSSIIDGLWDTNNPNEQSRVGPYIVFDSIIPIDIPVKINFSDGSGNSYTITPKNISYIPVKASESSSGTYSGGSSKDIAIDIAQFNEIFISTEKLVTNKELQSKKREMGTGSMKIIFKNSEMKAVIRNGKDLQSYQAFLNQIINKL